MATNDPIAVVTPEEIKQLHHDQINAAYKSGIRKCIAIVKAGHTQAQTESKMNDLLKELYC